MMGKSFPNAVHMYFNHCNDRDHVYVLFEVLNFLGIDSNKIHKGRVYVRADQYPIIWLSVVPHRTWHSTLP